MAGELWFEVNVVWVINTRNTQQTLTMVKIGDY